MSTKPTPKPHEESRKRQTRYLVGAGVILTALIVGLISMDRSGASRDENRARSNEMHGQDPERPVAPTP